MTIRAHNARTVLRLGTSAGLLAMLLFTVAPELPSYAATTTALPAGVTALYGANEYATANAIASAAYPHGTTTAVITSGATADWVDALLAAPLATALHAPILLSTSATTIGPSALAELDALGVTHVVLVGATAAASAQWAAQLPPNTTITAIGTTNPYATAGLVAQALAKQEGVTSFSHVFITSGVSGHLVDALAADPVAAAAGDPILLVPASGDSGQVDASELPYLNQAHQATIVGAAQGYAYTDLPASVTRTTIYGQDRAGTATALDQAFAPANGYSHVFIANGVDAHLVDALSAGPLMAMDHAALLEVYDGTVPPSTVRWLQSSAATTVHQVTVLGGPASIPSALYNAAQAPLLQTLTNVGVHPTLTASQTSVATGTRVTLQVQGVGSNQPVTWQVTSANASTSVLQGQGPTAAFVGTAAGTYTIQAQVEGTTLTQAVTIYGTTASQFTITSAVSTVVADGQDTTPVTIQAEDAAGTAIPTWNGTVTLTESPDATYTQNGAPLPAGPTANTGLVTLTNGVATVNVGQIAVPGMTLAMQTAEATPMSGSTVAAQPTYGTFTVTSVLPVATALQFVQPPQYLASNVAGTTTPEIPVEVVDQAGYALLDNVIPITLTLQGPGTLSASGTSTGTVTYNGNLAPAGVPNSSASFQVAAEQGATGTITVTASAEGLTPATMSLQAVIAGVATQIVPTLSQASLVTNASLPTPPTLTLQAEDATGVPVSDTTPVMVTVTPANSQTPSTTVTLTPTQGTLSGATANTFTANNDGTWTFDLADTGAMPGPYTITVAPVSGTTPQFPTQTTTLTVTAGTLGGAQVTSPTGPITVAASDPTATYTIQLTDTAGFPVQESGIQVQVYAVEPQAGASESTDGLATVNRVSTSASQPLTVTTDAQGQASVNLTATGIPGSEWQLLGTIPKQPGVTSAIPMTASPTMSVAVQAPAQVQLALTDASAGPDHGSSAYALAGNTVDATVQMTDQYGIPMSGTQTIQLTIPAGLSGQQPKGSTLVNATQWVYGGTNTVTLPVTLNVPTGDTTPPSATIPLTAWTAGPTTLTAAAVGTATPVEGSASLYVQAGAFATAGVFENGQALTAEHPLAVTANTPVALTVVPTDTADNPTTATYATVIALNDGTAGGAFRLTPSGASISTVTLPAGSSGTTVYYVNGSTTTVVPTAGLAAQGLVLNTPTPSATTGNGTVTGGTGASTTVTATVYATAPTTPLVGQTVTATVTGGGTLNATQAVGGSTIPSVSFTYTAPSTGSGTATVTLQVPGQGAADTVLTRTITIAY